MKRGKKSEKRKKKFFLSAIDCNGLQPAATEFDQLRRTAPDGVSLPTSDGTYLLRLRE